MVTHQPSGPSLHSCSMSSAKRRIPCAPAAAGFGAGLLLATGIHVLGIDDIAPLHWGRYPVLAALVCAAAAHRLQKKAVLVLCIGALLPWLALVGLVSTPAAGVLGRSLSREDRLRPAVSLLVLSSDIRPDGTPDRGMQWRLDHAYRLIEAGFAEKLLVPRLAMREASYLPAIRSQLAERGLKCEVVELGRVRNTHDEVLELTRYLERTKLDEVILVTEALHMRRVSALCRKTGARIVRSPSAYADFDYRNPTTPSQRLAAFRVWLKEVYYFELNRLCGWI